MPAGRERTETVALVLERDQCQGKSLGAYRLRHVKGLPGRYHSVLQTLQNQHRRVEPVKLGDRGTLPVDLLAFRPRSNQGEGVAGFRLVGFLDEGSQIPDAVGADAGG